MLTWLKFSGFLSIGTDNYAQLPKWREDWVEDKDAANEEEISNCLCLIGQIKHGYSVSLLWFKRNVSIVRVFIILGDVITFVSHSYLE